MSGQGDIMSEVNKDERDRRKRDGGVDKPAAQENAEAITKIIQGLGKK